MTREEKNKSSKEPFGLQFLEVVPADGARSGGVGKWTNSIMVSTRLQGRDDDYGCDDYMGGTLPVGD